MSDPLATLERHDGVAALILDDGKANALSPAMIDALHGALDRVDDVALALTARPDRFRAGFDLCVMMSRPAATRSLVTAGAEPLTRLDLRPCPVVVASTGHALAGGAPCI